MSCPPVCALSQNRVKSKAKNKLYTKTADIWKVMSNSLFCKSQERKQNKKWLLQCNSFMLILPCWRPKNENIFRVEMINSSVLYLLKNLKNENITLCKLKLIMQIICMYVKSCVINEQWHSEFLAYHRDPDGVKFQDNISYFPHKTYLVAPH